MATKGLRYVTGRRATDAALFVALVVVIITTGWRLGVYHEVVYVQVSWVEIDAAGDRQALGTPDQLDRIGGHGVPVRSVVLGAERHVRDYMVERGLADGGRNGERYEWTITWAVNSDEPADTRTIEFGPP